MKKVLWIAALLTSSSLLTAPAFAQDAAPTANQPAVAVPLPTPVPAAKPAPEPVKAIPVPAEVSQAQPAPPPAPPAATTLPKADESPAKNRWQDRTLDEEKELLKKRLEKLERMTPQEWDKLKQERSEIREKWEKMTPEEKEAFKKGREERKEQREEKAAAPK